MTVKTYINGELKFEEEFILDYTDEEKRIIQEAIDKEFPNGITPTDIMLAEIVLKEEITQILNKTK